MNKREYLEKRKEIQNKCEDDLAALDKVFAMFGGTPVASDESDDTPPVSRTWNFEISKRETVRQAVLKLSQATFTTKDVRISLDREYPEHSQQIDDNQISAIVSWLASTKGEIKVHTKKYGSSPAVYERKTQAQVEVLKAKAN
jgi:hypothetical protein